MKKKTRGKSIFSQRNSLLFLALLVIVSFALRLLFFLKAPLLYGHDAPYYLNGLSQLLSTGRLPGSIMEFSPVFFYASAAFAQFFEINLAMKVTAALFSSLLAASVFVLARRLLKGNKTALVAAAFSVFAVVPLRLLNGFEKNLTALFFVPLFFYFFFKAAGKDKSKNIAIALLLLLLTFLSHPLVAAYALLVLLCFVFFRYGFERKTGEEARSAAIVLAVVAVALAALFAVFPSSFEKITGFASLINNTSSASSNALLWQYFSVLLFSALFGAFYCFARPSRERLFLLSWLLVSLFVALPLSSGDNNWRFVFMALLPIVFCSAVFFQEFKRKFGFNYAALAFCVFLLLSVFSFFGYAQQLQPVFSQQDLEALKEIDSLAGKEAVVFAKGNTLQAAKFFLRAEARDFDANSVFEEASVLQDKNQAAFVLLNKATSQILELSSEPYSELSDAFFETAFSKANFLLLKPKRLTKDEKLLAGLSRMSSNPAPKKLEYEPARLRSLIVWVFFPAELPNLLRKPASSLLKAVLGIPLGLCFIGFVLSLVKKLFGKNKWFELFGLAIVLLIVLLLVAMR